MSKSQSTLPSRIAITEAGPHWNTPGGQGAEVGCEPKPDPLQQPAHGLLLWALHRPAPLLLLPNSFNPGCLLSSLGTQQDLWGYCYLCNSTLVRLQLHRRWPTPAFCRCIICATPAFNLFPKEESLTVLCSGLLLFLLCKSFFPNHPPEFGRLLCKPSLQRRPASSGSQAPDHHLPSEHSVQRSSQIGR